MHQLCDALDVHKEEPDFMEKLNRLTGNKPPHPEGKLSKFKKELLRKLKVDHVV